MKSKSFDLKRNSSEKGKPNKTFDFISLYKPAETTKVSEKLKGDGVDKENNFVNKSKNETPRRESSPNKSKKRSKQELLDISHINIEGPTLDASLHRNTPFNDSKVTSTPHGSDKIKNHVKSIMKNSSIMSDTCLDSSNNPPYIKSKKRNKSVSFMLDDNDEVVKKKTKSEDSLVGDEKKDQDKPRKLKKGLCKADIIRLKNAKKMKKQQIEKANSIGDTASIDTDTANTSLKSENDTQTSNTKTPNLRLNHERKKTIKKIKKPKKPEGPPETMETEDNNNVEPIENKSKKLKKKKHTAKLLQISDTVDNEEPARKSRKKDVKPEVIVENLENLSIGDNPHTLTSLLDEMTVADKDKRKKNKRKLKKNKVHTVSTSSAENADVDKPENGKEKVKWKKRKWNKDKKGEVVDDTVATSVIVENLPLTMMCSYKKVLAEHFEKCGLIKRIGVAEVFPSESNMVFTTTINFYSDGAATEALEENGVEIESNRIRVKRPLPPTQTTVVVRSYAALSDQSICSAFAAAGKIRNIRHLVKGKKAIETVFIEFDGPEAVERALELGKGAKVAGKKIHVNRFEVRKKKKSKPTPESENEGDTEDSD